MQHAVRILYNQGITCGLLIDLATLLELRPVNISCKSQVKNIPNMLRMQKLHHCRFANMVIHQFRAPYPLRLRICAQLSTKIVRQIIPLF